MKQVRSGVSREIAEDLRKKIIASEIPPGTPLRQGWVADAYQASHVPVREALQALEAEGLVVYRPRKGSVVAPLSRADMEDITDMREALESLAFRRSLERGGVDFEAAQRALEEAGRSDRLDDWVALNYDFHRALYAGAERPRVQTAIEGLMLGAERYLRAAWAALDHQETSQKEHAELLNMAREGNILGAEELLRRHIRQAGEGLAALIG